MGDRRRSRLADRSCITYSERWNQRPYGKSVLNLKPRFIPPERLYWPATLKSAVVALVFGLGYFLLGELGLLINSGFPGVTPFWPASGLALLIFILYGPRHWPGIFIGIGLLAYSQEIPMEVAFLAACGHVLEALLGWYLITRFRIKLEYRRVGDVLYFALVAFTAPLVSSLFGSIAMVTSQLSDWTNFVLIWSMWWLGDAIGILLVVPFVLVWRNLVSYCRASQGGTMLDSDISEDCQYILRSNRVGQLAIYVLLLVLAALYSFYGPEVCGIL